MAGLVSRNSRGGMCVESAEALTRAYQMREKWEGGGGHVRNASSPGRAVLALTSLELKFTTRKETVFSRKSPGGSCSEDHPN